MSNQDFERYTSSRKNEFTYQMSHVKTMIKNNEIAFDVLFLRKLASETCIHIFH